MFPTGVDRGDPLAAEGPVITGSSCRSIAKKKKKKQKKKKEGKKKKEKNKAPALRPPADWTRSAKSCGDAMCA